MAAKEEGKCAQKGLTVPLSLPASLVKADGHNVSNFQMKPLLHFQKHKQRAQIPPKVTHTTVFLLDGNSLTKEKQTLRKI